MKTALFEEALTIVNGIHYDSATKYLLLASFVMYFKTPLKNESWNTFAQRVHKKEISVRAGIFSTDQEKNPDFWRSASKTTKAQMESVLLASLISVRDGLRRKRLFSDSSELVSIPDLSSPGSSPTLFPKKYLQNQIQQGKFNNELTGHPLAWDIVEYVRNGSTLQSHARKVSRTVPTNLLKELVLREIEQIRAYQEACIVCKKKFRQFKTLKDYQTVYFCSLRCLSDWQH